MKRLTDLSGKNLSVISLGHSQRKVHPAWKDDTNDCFLICYELIFSFEDGSHYLVKPCELDLPDRFPALGLSIDQVNSSRPKSVFTAFEQPNRVVGIEQSDFLGEDTINQYSLILDNQQRIIIRHVFPPMSMGIKIENGNA
ncbi:MULTISPECIES: hypothetical protein [Pseudoalteromonas]|uniref:Uncharacterized protein n=1 Tax=Pseudoalteromonas haloplanktis TaxID=228 RepID=A0ABU1BGS4_PSEHA|nr:MULTISPECIES: hypothetical protein [Pseudoalteromonas]MDQ9093683.1 hypothetical protein [Pseudoalteromonas haloplanktis]